MAKPYINTHRLVNSTERTDPILARILNRLRQPQNFRTALPLYRRLQFGRFFEGSLLLTNLSLDETTNGQINGTTGASKTETEQPWLAAFVDRSCRPETEVWLFGSWEPQTQTQHPTTTSVDSNENDTRKSRDTTEEAMPALEPKITALLSSLLQSIKSITLPPSVHANPTADSSVTTNDNDVDAAGLTRSSYSAHASNPSITLWGAIHSSTFFHLQALKVLAKGSESTSVPNHMFIFSVDDLPETKDLELPAGLRWGKLGREHFALVKSRTQIPRQDRTMAVLPNFALFPTEGTEEERASPVAWAFVGLDSSLTTLHVEPEYRRQGLAKTLTTKLLREEMDVFFEDGMERLAQGYVIVGNEASAGMCRALGGRADWEVYWLRVDLSQV